MITERFSLNPNWWLLGRSRIDAFGRQFETNGLSSCNATVGHPCTWPVFLIGSKLQTITVFLVIVFFRFILVKIDKIEFSTICP